MISASGAATLLMLEGKQFANLVKDGWIPDGEEFKVADVVQGYIRHLRDKAQFASTAEMISELGISDARLHQLAGMGIFHPVEGLSTTSGKRWNRLEVWRAWVAFKTKIAEKGKKADADTALRVARAKDYEVRTQERTRELIKRAEAEFAVAKICGKLRTEIGGAPAQISRDIAMQRHAESVLDGCLERLDESLGRVIGALRAGSESDSAGEETDAG